jgi:hypothetical protein
VSTFPNAAPHEFVVRMMRASVRRELRAPQETLS